MWGQRSAAHGETWLVRNDVVAQRDELSRQKVRLEEAIRRLDIGIDQAQQRIEEEEEEEGPLYDDDFDFADRFDPHDREDPEVLLEERQELKMDLQDQLQEVNTVLAELEESRLNFTWGRRDVPVALHRLDRPWEDFLFVDRVQRKQEAVAVVAAEKTEIEKQRKKAERKGKKFIEPKRNQVHRDVPSVFCAKLHQPGPAVSSDGRVFAFSDSVSGLATTLVKEVQAFSKFSWRLIVERANFDFEEVGILPILRACEVQIGHQRYRQSVVAGAIMPYMEKGSVEGLLQVLANKHHPQGYKEELLLKNAKTLINSLAYLEHHGIFHGNIHPSNMFVSDDGFRLLIGDFLPPSAFKTWMSNISKGLSRLPRARDLGRAQLCTFLKPVGMTCTGVFNENPKRLPVVLSKLTKGATAVSPELLNLITRMLTLDPRTRPSFRALLDAGSQWRLKAADLASGAASLFGVAKPRGEELYFDKELTPEGYGTRAESESKSKTDDAEDKDGSSCIVM